MLRSSQDLDLQKLVRSIGFFGPEGAPATYGDTLRATMTETLADYAFQADSAPLAPVDERLQAFLDRYLGRLGIEAPRLPGRTLSLNRWGLARMLSLPRSTDSAESPLLRSYRLRQGVLHNPVSDRRTTQGVFHVAEGGLPIPDDKKEVPASVFAKLVYAALRPPEKLARLPFYEKLPSSTGSLVSLLLRPLVRPAVPGWSEEKRMEIRFFAPGSLVSNLDFVESIFGNAGDPRSPEGDAALDPAGWTGHTGGVILAPHLIGLTKKELGLPSFDEATARQKRDGMCWKTPEEKYNDGGAFKITARDTSGVILTLIADNYYGYCKKEVKTQISFSTNLLGNAEEEHAGGAVVFPTYDLGEDFQLSSFKPGVDHTFAEALEFLGDEVDIMPEGHARDRQFPTLFYIPETSRISLSQQTITWDLEGSTCSTKLVPGNIYLLPSGYKIEMKKGAISGRWRLNGTTANGLFCHKPCTVSGGGKSEISKSLTGALILGPVIVKDAEADFDLVEEVLKRNYADRFCEGGEGAGDSRSILSPARSLGSVIKLLTPSPEYAPAYNAWLARVPDHIKELVLTVKRLDKPSWNGDWRGHFSTDHINGQSGHELKYHKTKLVTIWLRVGFTPDGEWRTFSLRADFLPCRKIQTEDDITASTVAPVKAIPAGLLGNLPKHPGVKFAANTEYRLFQRPDDAIHPGADAHAETDLATDGVFISNFEPLTAAEIRAVADNPIKLEGYSPVMRNFLTKSASEMKETEFAVCSSFSRIVDGKPTKNPRYLQTKPPLLQGRDLRLAEMGIRLYRGLSSTSPALFPVDATLAGRRNNPAEKGVRSLAVFGPVHHLELPELFLEYISSMTGKSPSTTGAGSEGAMTKGPFNALPTIYDLNEALVSEALTGSNVFITAAGYVGPKYRVDHDVSLLIPELWSRMNTEERSAEFLKANGYLERCPDVPYEGRTLPYSRMGWRITTKFCAHFLGRVFSAPGAIFPEDMLRPELQDLAEFADGVDNICETHKRVAEGYFRDGSVEQAAPPLQALLHLMAHGHWNGFGLSSPEVRNQFKLESILASSWYAERLASQQASEIAQASSFVAGLEEHLKAGASDVCDPLLAERLDYARNLLAKVSQPEHLAELRGSPGRTPLPGE